MAGAVLTYNTRSALAQPVDGFWGSTRESDVLTQVSVLFEAGIIEGEVEPSRLWTDALISEINDFDEEAVRQAARNY